MFKGYAWNQTKLALSKDYIDIRLLLNQHKLYVAQLHNDPTRQIRPYGSQHTHKVEGNESLSNPWYWGSDSVKHTVLVLEKNRIQFRVSKELWMGGLTVALSKNGSKIAQKKLMHPKIPSYLKPYQQNHNDRKFLCSEMWTQKVNNGFDSNEKFQEFQIFGCES